MKIEQHENEIEMLQDQHFQLANYFDNLPDDSEAGINKLESQMEELEDDIQYHLNEIEKLKANHE